MDDTQFDIYAVGVLHSLRRYRASGDRRRLWRDLGIVRRELRRRDWHNLRQSFNGWLAEPVDYPDGQWRYCGRGWTRKAAVRNFWRRNDRWQRQGAPRA